jgi:hypothetical protein
VSAFHIVCPFPPCTAEWWIGGGHGQTIFEVPLHLPQGFEGADRYDLRCPGALLRPRLDGPDATPLYLPDDVELITRAYERHLLWLAKTHDEQAAERGAIDATLNDLDRRDRENEPPISPEPPPSAGAYMGGPLGRPADWERPREEYFPGRPADAPEPGPGDPPAGYVPSGVEGIHLTGRDAMDNAHDTTKGLVLLAMAKMNETQGKLAGCAAALGGAVGLATMAEMEATAGNALVIAAVGTGAGKPRSAEAMAEQMAVAVDTIMGEGHEGGNLFNAIEIARIRVEAAAQQIAAALQQAEQYVALLS